MVCPKCNSEDVNVQVVTETQLKRKYHGAIWWICLGWYWVPIKWLFFFFPALIVKIFAPKRQKLKAVHKGMAVCQNCSYVWEAK